ncbi:MAG: hypothetical protein ACTHN5_00840 [Phycisphaerae bacterium]
MPLATLLIGLTCLTLGTLITAINFYTSFLRYPLHRRRGGTRENFRFISGFPLLGSFLLFLALLFLSHHPPLQWTALAIALLDAGGPHWLIATLLYMLLFGKRTNTGNVDPWQ